MKKYENPMTMKELLENMEADAEQYGQYHDDDCPFMREDGADSGDTCECEIIRALKTFAREHMQQVHLWWVRMANNEKDGEPMKSQEAKHFAAKMNGTNRKP